MKDKCYQCILCPPMFFQRKKNLQKRLWGLRVTITPKASSSQEEMPYERQPPQQLLSPPNYRQSPNSPRNQMTSSPSTTHTMDIDHPYYPQHQQNYAHQNHHQQQQQHHHHHHTENNSFLMNCCARSGGGCCGGGGGCGTDSSTNCSIDGDNVTMYSNSSNNSSTNNNNPNYLETLFLQLVKKLKDVQMETLYKAIEQDGKNEVPDCVLLPRNTIKEIEPHVLACRIWKWPDLICSSEIKRLPLCQNDQFYICCNPQHWLRMMPDPPPPAYDSIEKDMLIHEDRSRGEENAKKSLGSLPTDAEVTIPGWCNLAYWELQERVGDQLKVLKPHINVFSNQVHGDGMCLTDTAQSRKTITPDRVKKARKNVGLGTTLSWESDGMWMYNRSNQPIFVHSPTRLAPNSDAFLVIRVAPGHCLNAFERLKYNEERFERDATIANKSNGPRDQLCVHISFGKGFGPKYKRPNITQCPCWIQVLLKER